MLSRLLPRSAGLRSSVTGLVRHNTTAVAVSSRPRDQVAEDWENFKMPLAPYEGMGPLPPLPTWDPKCMRHYVFPEYWFEFLYPRLGVTGPYTLGLGTLAFLMSKEILVYTPELINAFALTVVATGIMKAVGPSLKDTFAGMTEHQYDCVYKLKMDEIDAIEAEVEEVKTEKWRSGLQELYHDVKKSNLALMLETEFLNRRAALAGAIKRRLDYQIAVQQTEREIAHAHMVNWIEDKVQKSITPESQKQTLDVCIARLNAMNAK